MMGVCMMGDSETAVEGGSAMLRRLRYFQSVVRLNSFSQAA